MSQPMSEAMKSAKTIQAEMVQWDNRLEHAKSEHANIKRQADLLQQEIDQKRSDYENYIAGRDKQLKDGTVKLAEDQRMLESQRLEFKGILEVHEKEKQRLAHERMLLDNEKAALDGQKRLCQDFVQAVRRAINVLPD